MNRLTADEFKAKKKTQLVVILDNVRSLHNVGSVFRTADAFLVEAVFLCDITSTPPHAEIHKTALGAENTVDWKYFEDTHLALEELQTHGYTIFAIEQAVGSTLLTDLKLDVKKNMPLFLATK